MGLLSWLNPLEHITNALTGAYRAKLQAENDEQRIAADVEIAGLEAKRDAIIAASSNDKWWSTRELIGKCVLIFVAKIIIWDTVLGLGTTEYPGQLVMWITVTVIGFYFVSKTAETITGAIAGSIARRAVR